MTDIITPMQALLMIFACGLTCLVHTMNQDHMKVSVAFQVVPSAIIVVLSAAFILEWI